MPVCTEDTPLPIASGQTISQPYIVALMLEALQLHPGDRVLEVGTGSGYAAAVADRIAREVWTVERYAALAEGAAATLRRLGQENVQVRHSDGTLGWPERAPFDAIVVAAGGPEIPPPLIRQLAAGGRLVIPVGADRSLQSLIRVTRMPDGGLREEDLGSVRFVPLIGIEGWAESRSAAPADKGTPASLPLLLREAGEPITGLIDSLTFDATLDRIGDARVVCIGEATHGTSEFYRYRARLTRRLIETKGFTLVGLEADWPDAASHRPVRSASPVRSSRVERLRAVPGLDVAEPWDVGLRGVAPHLECGSPARQHPWSRSLQSPSLHSVCPGVPRSGGFPLGAGGARTIRGAHALAHATGVPAFRLSLRYPPALPCETN